MGNEINRLIALELAAQMTLIAESRLTPRDKLERQAREPMRSEREQRAPGPLFDDTRNQLDMWSK